MKRSSHPNPPWIVLVLAVLLLGTATAASATTYTVPPAADAFVYQADPNQNYGQDYFLLIRDDATGQAVSRSSVSTSPPWTDP